MKINKYGIVGYSQTELVNALKINPATNVESIFCTDPESYNSTIDELFLDFRKLENWNDIDTDGSVEEFHRECQNQWLMPDEFKTVDINELLLGRCSTDEERERVITELELFNKYKLIPLLQYLNYLVTIIRQNKIVLGVGRGSSCASYCLYLLGIHRINSIKFDLDIHEFLRDK